MTEAELHSFLSQHKLGVLSTISAAGKPQSGLVGIAITSKLEVVFDTVKSSRKYPNLIARPACSFVIGLAGEKTVQYEGTARELEPPQLERYQKTYFAALPDGPDRLTWPGIVYFAVTPVWIRYSDFTPDPPMIREFGFTKERA
ncbi:MAG: pyridoxamine 5'-phosphate oxidase family protein [Bryobacteraceae bacterium]